MWFRHEDIKGDIIDLFANLAQATYSDRLQSMCINKVNVGKGMNSFAAICYF